MKTASLSDSLAIIIPAYNEEKGLGRCLDDVMRVAETLPIETKVIVVNDGSRDKTPEIIKASEKRYPRLVGVHHNHNQGYGAGLRTGIRKAQELGLTWCLFMDSDLTNPPCYIRDFVAAMRPDVDCVKASRYIAGGKMVGVPFKRRLISLAGNLIAATLFGIGIKDCTNGFRMVRTEQLRHIPYRETNFSIILEELYYLKKQHARFVDFPNVLTSRTDTQTNFRYTPRIFWDYFKYALKARLT